MTSTNYINKHIKRPCIYKPGQRSIAELWVEKLGWGQIPFSQNDGEYDKHNQYWIFNHLFRFLEFNHVADLMSTTSIITNMFIPNNNKTNHPTQKKTQ